MKKRRLLAVLVSACMVLTMFPVGAFAESGIEENLIVSVNEEREFGAANTVEETEDFMVDSKEPNEEMIVSTEDAVATGESWDDENVELMEVSSGSCGSELSWTLDEGGKLTISGTGTMWDWDNVSKTPWYNNRSTISSIVISSGVTNIGNHAFQDVTNMSRVTIPSTVSVIGNNAFQNCDGLSSIDIPSSVTSIGTSAFYDCDGVVNIKIADSVESLGNYVFYSCDKLRMITLPSKITGIPAYAFQYCNSLMDVSIPVNVSGIGAYAFNNCARLSDVYYEGTQEQWDEISLGTYNPSLSGPRFHYENMSTYVAYTQKSSNGICGRYLTWSLDSGGKLTISGKGSMWDWTSASDTPWYNSRSTITSIVIENGVQNIGHYAFYDVSKMSGVHIASTVSIIGKYSFQNCDGLMNMEIPDGIKTIGEYAFYDCDGIVNIKIADSVESLGNYAFYSCDTLRMLTLPSRITGIPASAFQYCNSLMDVAIPSGVSGIGSYAFNNCPKLSDIYYEGTQEQWDQVSIGTNNQSLTGPRYHFEDMPAYTVYKQNASNGLCGRYLKWSLDNGGKLTISGTGSMWNWISASDVPWYSSRSSVTAVVISDGVQNIGNYAFYDTSKMSGVSIASTVSIIGKYAFYNCDGIASIIMPSSVIDVGEYAFYDCDGMKSVRIPDSVNNVGAYAFYSCDSLTEATLSSRMTGISANMFQYCSKLLDIYFPGSITGVGAYAFNNCSKLRDVYYGCSEEQWDNVSIGVNNEPLLNANIIYSSQPATVAVTGVSLNQSKLTLKIGQTALLTVTVAPSDATNKNVSWSTDNANVATVSNGTVTAKSEGTATITVTTEDGNKQATCTVTVSKKDDPAPVGDVPLKLVSSYSKGTKTATVSIVTTSQITLANYDMQLGWDQSVFALNGASNGQGGKLSSFVSNLNITDPNYGKISAMSGGGNVTVNAGETLASYTLTTANALNAGDYAFTLIIKDVADQDASPLSWKGGTVAGTLTVSKLSLDEFDNRTKEKAVINCDNPAAGDFTVACGNPCVVIYNNGSGYKQISATAVSGTTNIYSFNLPGDYNDSVKIVVCMKGDFTGEGEISSTDALQVLRASVGSRVYDAAQVLIADMNNDQSLTSTDALQILRLSVGTRNVVW